MQKDYWSISKSNFRALGVLTILAILVYGLAIVNAPIEAAQKTGSYIFLLILIVVTVFLFVIGDLFKKQSPKAIVGAYIYFGLWLVSFVVTGFIMSPPLSGIVMKIIQLLILYYVYINVRNASKQTPPTSVL